MSIMAKKYGRAETVALEKSDGTAYELRAQSPWQEKLTVTASIFLLASHGIAAAESFDNLEQALENPERVTVLSLNEGSALEHIPAKFGSLLNLTELDISSLEEL